MKENPILERSKSVDERSDGGSRRGYGSSTELKRSIPFSILILLAINAIIGTGIFFVPGIAARIAGPASLLSWVLVAILALFIAACFAELVSMFPKSGGVYEFTKRSLGNFGGFIVGWTSWVVANITIAMLAVGSLDYLSGFMHFPIWYKIIIALTFVGIINIVSIKGIDLSVKVLLIFAAITIISLWALISWGIYYFDATKILNPISIFPKISVAIAMLYIMETFFGWETVTYLAEETKDPTKVIPKVMMWGTLLVVLLAIGVVTVTLGSVPLDKLASSIYPLVDAAKIFMGSSGASILAILIFLNIIGGAAAWIVVTPRLIYAIARDGLLPSFLSKVHPKFQTPVNAILLQMVLTSIVILSGSYLLLLEVLLPLAIFMYAMVIISVSILRFTQPNLERSFKVPLGKYSPIIAAAIMLFLAGGINIQTIASGAMLIILGIPLYLIKGVESSTPEVITFMSGISSGISSIFISKRTRLNIYNYFKDLKKRRILHMGAGNGILTTDLAEIVGPEGVVFATEISENNLNKVRKKARKKGHKNIEFIIEDPKNRHKLHKHIKGIHAVTSIGLLGYLNNPDKVLHEINKRMVKNARIYFIDYDRVFKLMHTKEWLKDDKKIIDKFTKHGFNIKVKREKGILWDTIKIYGWKNSNI